MLAVACSFMPSSLPVGSQVLDAFGCSGSAVLLHGGEGRAYRAGNIVLRQEDDDVEANYIADVFSTIEPNGFRISRPIRNQDGGWLAGGWSAWTFLEGVTAQAVDLPLLVPAIRAFHEALSHIDKPSYLDTRNSLYDRADDGAWSGCYEIGHPQMEKLLAPLEVLRKPLTLPEQLIHGDLNPGNFLVAPGEVPALIDMAPYWRPEMFSSAIAAYWFGPYQANIDALLAFPPNETFAQLLLRASVRCLLIVAATDPRGGAEYHLHARATEMACSYIGRILS